MSMFTRLSLRFQHLKMYRVYVYMYDIWETTFSSEPTFCSQKSDPRAKSSERTQSILTLVWLKNVDLQRYCNLYILRHWTMMSAIYRSCKWESLYLYLLAPSVCGFFSSNFISLEADTCDTISIYTWTCIMLFSIYKGLDKEHLIVHRISYKTQHNSTARLSNKTWTKNILKMFWNSCL